MIKLRLVGASDDLQHLVYSNKKTGKRGSHIVPIDDDLFDTLEEVVHARRAEIEEERAASRAAAPRVDSKLPPREVQRQLRAGRTVEQVARSADVPVEWVEQFLTPVLYERMGVINEVKRAWLDKQRLGVSGAPLGDAVTANLHARHVRLTDQEIADAWDATRVEGQPWIVTLRFRFRGREQKATWRYDPTKRTVTAGNRLAADLGWIAPGRKIPSARTPARKAGAAADTPSAPKKTARKGAAKKTARKPVAKKRASARKPARKTTTARKASARKASPRKATARKATARKSAPPRKRAAARKPARRPARPGAAARGRTASRSRAGARKARRR